MLIPNVLSPSATSGTNTEYLRQVFTQFAVTETIVTDRVHQWQVQIISEGKGTLTSYFSTILPSLEWVGCTVQIMKHGLKKVTQGTLNTQLSKVLCAYG